MTKKFEEKVTDTFANYDSKISLLEKDNAALHAKIDSLEQYTRRNSIRIFGVHEESNENTLNVVKSIFSDTLKAADTLTWIDRCHRIRNKNQLATFNRPAAIIVKFSSYHAKQIINNNKKLLKGSGISINDDLTRLRHNLYREAVKKVGRRNAWVFDGNIFAKSNGTRFSINTADDLQRFP